MTITKKNYIYFFLKDIKYKYKYIYIKEKDVNPSSISVPKQNGNMQPALFSMEEYREREREEK